MSSVWYYTWDAILINAVGLAIIIATVIAAPEHMILLYISLVASALLTGFGITFYGWLRPRYRYEIKGLRFEFRTKDYYVPKEIMEIRVNEFMVHMRNYLNRSYGDGGDVWRLLDGVQVIVLDERPLDPRNPNSSPIGVTRPDLRNTEIYGPYVTDDGGLGYELKLQICQVLFPWRSEEEDIKWMKDNKILRDLP